VFASVVRVPAEARQKRTELDSSVLSGAAFDAARSSNLVAFCLVEVRSDRDYRRPKFPIRARTVKMAGSSCLRRGELSFVPSRAPCSC
jgi:hypothetical protein